MRNSRRRARKRRSKGGRPRKSIAELRATGGYDRNPGRLLKRMGIVSAPLQADPEITARWDKIFASLAKQERETVAYQKACELDGLGDYEGADRVLRKAGVSEDAVTWRRKHIAWRLKQGLAAV